MQSKRTRACDSRGRAVPGIYRRAGHFIAGYRCPQSGGKWRMVTLKAETLTEAKRERAAILAGLRDGSRRAPDGLTVDALFADFQQSRNLSERTRAHERHLYARHLSALHARRAQDVTATELARLLRDLAERGYSAWTRVAVHRLIRGTFALAVRPAS